MPPRDFACLQLQARHWALLRDLLARHAPQAEAWAYGSRVDGTAHETSDLDVVLRHPTDLSQDVPGWDDLKEAIQNSRLPILVDLHMWSRLPQSFHANIEAGYVVLQAGRDDEDQLGNSLLPNIKPPERERGLETDGDDAAEAGRVGV